MVKIVKHSFTIVLLLNMMVLLGIFMTIILFDFGGAEVEDWKVEEAAEKKRILFAFYGQKNRDRACAKISHYRIVDGLKQAGFDVHTHQIVHGMEGGSNTNVDNVPYTGYFDKCAYDTCELKDFGVIKEEVDEMCKTKPCYTLQAKYKSQKFFAAVQLHSEWSVGQYVRNHINDYDLVIAVSDDYYLTENFPIDQIEDAMMKNNTIYTSSANDMGGIQNGIYFGHPIPVAKMLCRFEAPVVGKKTGVWREVGRIPGFHGKWNYEMNIKWAFQTYGIQREPIRPYTVVAFVKVRHNQEFKWQPPPLEDIEHMIDYMYGRGGKPINPGPDIPLDLQTCLKNATLRELEVFEKAGPVQKSCLYMFKRPEGCGNVGNNTLVA